jgi:hypothetical protein
MPVTIERDGPITTFVRDRREARNAMDPADQGDRVKRSVTKG